MTKRHRLTVSVNHEAIVAGAAALRNKTPKAYLEEIITRVCVPEVVAGMVAAPLAPAPVPPSVYEEDEDRAIVHWPVHIPKPKPKPKPRKPRKPKRVKGRNHDGSTDLRTVKAWECPVCAKALTMVGAKVHFVTCALKIGLSPSEIAEYVAGDRLLAKGYAADKKTHAELVAVIQKCIDRFGHSWEAFTKTPAAKVRLREIQTRIKKERKAS